MDTLRFCRHFLLPLLLLIPLSVPATDNSDNSHAGSLPELDLTASQMHWVGQQVFRNECASKTACLVHWNKGEAFPSLGIGHFIWYPRYVNGRFAESFPDLIKFMRQQSVLLPDWLNTLTPFDAPWTDRAAFLRQDSSARVESLRRFLEQTKGVQAEFIVTRARAALSRVVAAAPGAEQPRIREQITALSATPGGTYALIDYVNFKGEGLKASESYKGDGWGLLQVLQEMADSDGKTALQSFRQAAATVLTRRASNAPRAIEREQWLPGWLARLKTYQEPD